MHDHDHAMPAEMMQKEDDNNRIWVGDVNDECAKNFINRVLDINAKDENAPIMVIIDSDGGSVDSLMSIWSIMDSVKNPFFTVAVGRAVSAGAAILAHGDVRCASPHARIMIHEMSGGAIGHIEDARVTMEEMEFINKYLTTTIAKDLEMTPSKYKALFAKKRDLYMSATEAQKLGVIDNIGIPTVKMRPPQMSAPAWDVSIFDKDAYYKAMEQAALDKAKELLKKKKKK